MSVVCLTQDLMASSSIGAAAKERGAEFAVALSLKKLASLLEEGGVSLVLIDLTLRGLDVNEAVQLVRTSESSRDDGASPIGIVAFGPHVHEGKLAAAQQAGCDMVLSKGQMHREAAQVIQRYC